MGRDVSACGNGVVPGHPEFRGPWSVSGRGRMGPDANADDEEPASGGLPVVNGRVWTPTDDVLDTLDICCKWAIARPR